MKRDQPTQADVNKVWENEWKNSEQGGAKALFGHRLFIEGYPVYRKYIPKDMRTFLDVGGGTGRYGVKFGQAFPEAQVFVTDILESSLDVARRLIAEIGVHNVLPQKEDAMNMSFSNDSFDVVFCDVVIQHLPDAKNVLREMRRVLKPGGVLIVSVNNAWNPHMVFKFLSGKAYQYGYEKSYTRKELRSLFLENQLNVVALDGFYPAYGVYRLKTRWKSAAIIGKILNRLNRIIDPWTGRFFSRYFGFEIFCVAQKSTR